MTAQPANPLDLLDSVLAALVKDFALSRVVAELFWRQTGVDFDDVDAIWRKYWGRGLNDDDG